MGSTIVYNTLSGNNIDALRTTRTGWGSIVQDEWKATQTLTLVAGARYDLDTFIHATVSPRVALLYRPAPDHTFRLSFSVAYRPPTLIETYSMRALHHNPASAISFSAHLRATSRLHRISVPNRSCPMRPAIKDGIFKHRLSVRANVFLITFRT